MEKKRTGKTWTDGRGNEKKRKEKATHGIMFSNPSAVLLIRYYLSPREVKTPTRFDSPDLLLGAELELVSLKSFAFRASPFPESSSVPSLRIRVPVVFTVL
jgi:hypothetical protein